MRTVETLRPIWELVVAPVWFLTSILSLNFFFEAKISQIFFFCSTFFIMSTNSLEMVFSPRLVIISILECTREQGGQQWCKIVWSTVYSPKLHFFPPREERVQTSEFTCYVSFLSDHLIDANIRKENEIFKVHKKWNFQRMTKDSMKAC